MSAGCKAEQQLLHPGPTAGRGLQQGSDQAGMGWDGEEGSPGFFVGFWEVK